MASGDARTYAGDAEKLDDELTDAEIERSLSQRRSEIAVKLATAQKSISDGDIAPLEPLEALLRAARRNTKTSN